MRNPWIGGNWKLHGTQASSIALAEQVKRRTAALDDKTIVVFPPYVYLPAVNHVVQDSNLHLGAQNQALHEEGAFTGEVSPASLKELGCDYIIVGHSERRAMGEVDELVGKKAQAVLANNMIPIICVGETLEEYEAGNAKEVLARQVSKTLENLDNKYFILAYEPVWAISTSGSGKTITAAEAIEQIKILKDSIPASLKDFDIVYGGSVKPDTVGDFSKDFKGALVGGASLKAQTFFDLIKNS